LVHGFFPMREALADSSANPRSCMPWNEPPTTDIASQAFVVILGTVDVFPYDN
jgi:hypothetical protein